MLNPIMTVGRHYISGLSFRNTMVGVRWAASVVHAQITEKTVLSPCRTPISGREAFPPVCTSNCWLRTMTIISLLMGGCGLSHEHEWDGCWGTCVKCGG